MAWRIQEIAGDVGEFHARPLPDNERAATFFRAETPTLVLASSQRQESVDVDAAVRQGVDVVRRRSGGGGVLLWPDEFVWLDLEIPASDELWSDDVGRATWWVGELWRSALADLSPLSAVHRGTMRRSRWSSEVCFAGTGPGEVMAGESKLVGVSQRRTRSAARFQTMVHLRWRPDVVASLVADHPSVDELATLVEICQAPAEDITARLIAALTAL
jgi:lipoate-protein ligase A